MLPVKPLLGASHPLEDPLAIVLVLHRSVKRSTADVLTSGMEAAETYSDDCCTC